MKAFLLFIIVAVTTFNAKLSAQSVNFNVSFLSSGTSFYNGGSGDVSYIVSEASDGAFLPAKVAIYYSSDNQLSGNDRLLDTNTVNLSQASPSEMVYRTFPVPQNLVSVTGTGYIILKVDYANAYTETNESDNIVSDPATFHKPVYNIDMNYMELNQDSGCAGQEYSAYVQMTNKTDYTVVFVITGIYLSTDNSLSSNDILLALDTLDILNDYPVPSSRNIAFTIPGNTIPRGYYIIAKADYDNRISETQEYNNSYSAAFELADCAPALSVENFLLNKDTAGTGNLIEYSVEIKNTGNADAGEVDYIIVCSLNNTFESSDVVLSSGSTYAPIGNIGTMGGSFNVPSGLYNANYKIFIKLDANDSYAETNEDDNIAMTSLFVRNLIQSVGEYSDNEMYSIKTFPGTHTIQVKSETDAMLQLYNLNGQLIYQEHMSSGNENLKITDLRNGIYMATIVTESKVVHIKKILIQGLN